MKKIYLFLLLTVSVVFLNNAQAQDVLAGWTFPTTSGNAPSSITSECGMISTATVYADGTNGSDNWTDATSKVFFGGVIPSTSLCSVTTTTGALSLVNVLSAYNGKSIVFKLSTTNYENLILNYDTRGTATGFTTHDWAYSTDGTTFTTFTTISGRNVTTYSSQSVDFSSVTALDNQANVYVKLTVSGASSATGNNRFDNIKFSATSTVSAPEINIASGSTNYLNNSTYSFGTVVTSTTVVTTFAVQNLGLATLNLTTASFTGGSEYIVNGAPIPATIAAGGVLTFSVEFTPTSAGTFTGVLSISSDDTDENPYLFNVTGVGNVPAPEINIISGATNYLNNSTYNFGTVVTSTTVVTTFAVQNLGIAPLNLTTASFTGGSEYVVNGAPIPATVAAGDVLTFSVEFTPTTAGTFTGVLSLSSDDADENPYLFNITGIGAAALTPEINIVQSTTSYTNGSTYSYSNTDQNWFTDAVFTIENTGNATLSISTYSITGTDYSLIGAMPTSVAASSVASFTLRFAPTALGTFTGSVTLTNNDANEGSYVVNLTGVSVLGTPAIFTENFGNPGGTSAIATYTGWSSTGLTFSGSGDIRATTVSNTYFGATGSGNAFLTNVAGRNIEISNVNTSTCSSFTLSFGVYKSATTADGSTLAVEVSSDGTNYTALTFDPLPTGAGTVGWYYRTASGTIPQAANLRIRFTNTSTLSQFRIDDLQLKGVCPPAPEINFIQGATSYLNGSTYNFGTVNTGSTNVLTFSIQNTGTATLNLTTATFTGGAAYTVISDAIPTTVAAGGIFTVTVVYSPTVAGTYTEVLTVNNNDADENPYVLNISSIVNAVAPEINIKQSSTNYLTGSNYNFSNTTILTSNTVVFTIENTGTADLNISNTSNNGSEFDVTSTYPIPLTISAGNTATYSVTFQPTVAGTYNGSVSFTSDDADEATYIVSYTGVAQNAPAPEINVVTTSLNFGSIEENTTADLTYVVQNTGNADLVLSTSTTAPYSITGTSPTTITAGNSATYTVRFSPTTTGTFTANVTISSNDADESSLTVSLTGIATVAMPAIFTETFGTPAATTVIASYTGWSNPTLTFTGTGDVRTTSASTGYTGASGSGNTFLTTGGTKNIEISNINTSSCTGLSLSFGVLKSVSGANGSELLVEVSSDGTNYTALTFPALPTGTGWNYVNASGTIPQAANLRIRFTNTSTTVQYRIDDVKLKGSCAPAPEINIVQSATTYLSGSTYNFGTAAVSSSNVVIFTIQNTGNADLNISNSTDAGAAEFTTTSTFPIPLTIAAGNTATFSVTFAPTAVGTYNGSITFDSNDSNEPAYVLSYTGVASTTTPEINLTQNGANFLTGATHSFGSVNQGTTNLVTFTVQNTGTASLTLSTYSFTGSSDFSYSSSFALPATILAGQSSTFTVTLAATFVGAITGAFSFSNDDASENPYLVNVSATVVSTSTVTAPEINVKQATTSIASGDTYAFGDIALDASQTEIDVVFTIENTGNAVLNIASHSITGSAYSLVGTMPTSVAASSTATFTVRFSTTSEGAFVGGITINNNDANEGVYTINFTGTATVSIEEINANNSISIYPNPNNGNILNFTKATDATIYNAIGAKVMEVKNADKVDVSVLENGIYMVNINNKTKRLIIAK
ncbi:MAG: choice-of-anchor D domain-containing protein [Bacteroidota bacterium]